MSYPFHSDVDHGTPGEPIARAAVWRPPGYRWNGVAIIDTTTGRVVQHGHNYSPRLARAVAALLSTPIGAPVLVRRPTLGEPDREVPAVLVGWCWDTMWPVVQFPDGTRYDPGALDARPAPHARVAV